MDNNSPARPLQMLSYEKKTPQWYRENGLFCMSRSRLGTYDSNRGRNFKELYGIYNSVFPTRWFSHITNPLNATKEEYKKYPARIRPINILRTNIDLLLGEWNRRPFVYTVENLGDSGYSSYMEGKTAALHQNITQQFMQAAIQEKQQQGQQLTDQEMAQLQQQLQLPEEIETDYKLKFRDGLSVKLSKWMKRTVRELEVKRKLHKSFKDFCITGEAYTYRGISQYGIEYESVLPDRIDYLLAENKEFIEDSERICVRYWMSPSEVVDRWYGKLTEDNVRTVVDTSILTSPMAMSEWLSGYVNTGGLIPIVHCQWQGLKRVKILSYFDPETFQQTQTEVDEDYPEEEGMNVSYDWKPESYEVWCIQVTGTSDSTNTGVNDGIFIDGQPIAAQRDGKLSYNGRRYSDTMSEPTSIMIMGMPILILHIIITYILEKTIAKSRGKIFLMDKNAISKEGEWDEEKTFYYADAMGYFLIDRSQTNVDKSWNQYQVLDMSLFDSIQQLISVQASLAQQWDELSGVNRQRRGETNSSDGQGVNERAIFQSTVMSDMLFLPMDELKERDLQCIADLCAYATANGENSLYTDDFGTQLLSILPGEFIGEKLGVFVMSAEDVTRKLNDAKQFVQAILQNEGKLSKALEVIDAENMAELKAKVIRIEEVEAQIAQQQNDANMEHEKDIESMKEALESLKSLLKTKEINTEYDRKEDLLYIQGTFDTFTAHGPVAGGDANNNNIPDAVEVEKLALQRKKLGNDINARIDQRDAKNRELDLKENQLRETIANNKRTHQVNKSKVSAAKKKKATAK